MYFDEDLILDIRLNTLDDKVDKFVVVEATKNHAGKDKKLNFKIEIDGGINFETSKVAINAGVDILVSGTTVFKENDGDLEKNIKILKQI